MSTCISVENLSFNYTEAPVLENVSCSINYGDYVGVLGPNGGGKSTFLLLILGLLKPSSGLIAIYDQKGEKSSRSIISWVPQHFSFDKSFPISVEEVVLTGRIATLKWHGQYTKKDYRAVDEALDLVGLLSKKHSCFSHLSGGQMQRILLARALCSNPAVLVLDEPTTNIDSKTQEQIYSILVELNRTKTIVMVTHDLHHTTKYFNKIFYLNKTLTPLSHNDPTDLYRSLRCCNNK
ncbi:metal ABC transporter ATP-binding protein [Chlamydiifrater phoenicopteri]|uniref:metal ABC transporter ATP-binding protein n=1 Tax=Chlamydiifrater phoenicopteri TaxID=2681469 RepID=UPI001BCDC0EC|nr:metal ABC transporter ATP-binding protein [Chlamydiifrater phoenicopteri]